MRTLARVLAPLLDQPVFVNPGRTDALGLAGKSAAELIRFVRFAEHRIAP
jgi:hypothetical protein